MRTAHYIRYEQDGEFQTALLETLDAKNALTTQFEAGGVSYDYHGKVEIPEGDGAFVLDHLD